MGKAEGKTTASATGPNTHEALLRRLDAGHGPHSENAAFYNHAVTEFLRRH